ncbi:MAG: glycosyltransferase family 1 protein, partial [Opitutaceae bacterium]|nr:glycosyltransferase family 1 protein [Opitutaceae bacterium]
MLYLDLTHTSHTRSQTGIQRVCRRLYETASQRAEPTAAVIYDHYRKAWRFPDNRETARLRSGTAEVGTHRKASWSKRDKVLGTLANQLRLPQSPLPTGSALIVPEFYGPDVSAVLPDLFARV